MSPAHLSLSVLRALHTGSQPFCASSDNCFTCGARDHRGPPWGWWCWALLLVTVTMAGPLGVTQLSHVQSVIWWKPSPPM